MKTKKYIMPLTTEEIIDFEMPVAQDTIQVSRPNGDDEGDGDDAAIKEREEFGEEFNNDIKSWGDLW